MWSDQMTKRSAVILLICLFVVGGCSVKQYRESKIRYQHRTWDDATVRKVAKREIVPGMTGEMVRAALGVPDSISREGDQERWGYAILVDDYQPRQEFVFFVYFTNSVVIKTSGNRDKLKTFSWYE